jgi:hypothetical protein
MPSEQTEYCELRIRVPRVLVTITAVDGTVKTSRRADDLRRVVVEAISQAIDVQPDAIKAQFI